MNLKSPFSHKILYLLDTDLSNMYSLNIFSYIFSIFFFFNENKKLLYQVAVSNDWLYFEFDNLLLLPLMRLIRLSFLESSWPSISSFLSMVFLRLLVDDLVELQFRRMLGRASGGWSIWSESFPFRLYNWPTASLMSSPVGFWFVKCPVPTWNGSIGKYDYFQWLGFGTYCY